MEKVLGRALGVWMEFGWLLLSSQDILEAVGIPTRETKVLRRQYEGMIANSETRAGFDLRFDRCLDIYSWTKYVDYWRCQVMRTGNELPSCALQALKSCSIIPRSARIVRIHSSV